MGLQRGRNDSAVALAKVAFLAARVLVALLLFFAGRVALCLCGARAVHLAFPALVAHAVVLVAACRTIAIGPGGGLRAAVIASDQRGAHPSIAILSRVGEARLAIDGTAVRVILLKDT
jgi:hypothetical protein